MFICSLKTHADVCFVLILKNVLSRDKKKKRSSKKSKKSGKKTIKRKDIKGVRVSKYVKDSLRQKLCKFFKEGNCAKVSTFFCAQYN